jgi:hypothetical protein
MSPGLQRQMRTPRALASSINCCDCADSSSARIISS